MGQATRRAFTVSLGAAVAAKSGAKACGQQEPGKTVLQGLTWRHPRGYAPLAATAARYASLHPSVEVRWEQREWYAFESRVSEVLLNKSREYDLVLLDHPWIGTFAKARCLMSFNEVFSARERDQLKRNAVAPSYESYVYDGELWALPVDGACHVFVYRQDLCDGAALPTDWEGVLAFGKRLADPPRRYALGFAFGGVEGFMLFLTLAATFGFFPYENPGKAVLPSQQGVKILELMRRLSRLGHPGSLAWTPRELLEHMSRAEDVCACPSVFGYVNFSYAQGGRRALSFTIVPGSSRGREGRAILGGMGLGIPAASRNKDEALRYARFVTSPEAQIGIFPENEGQPALLSAWRDDSVRRKTGSFYPAMLHCMSRAYMRPRFPGWMAIELESGKAITRYLRENLDPVQTLAELERIRALHAGRILPPTAGEGARLGLPSDRAQCNREGRKEYFFAGVNKLANGNALF